MSKFFLYPFVRGDYIAPTGVLTSAASEPVVAAFAVTVTFSEVVIGFALADITVTNGAASNLAGSGAVYTFDVTPDWTGDVSVSIAAEVCQDQSGNFNAASNTLTRQIAKIYGVSWNKSSSPILTRTDNAVGMVANAGVDSQVVQNGFDTAQIFSEMTEVTDALGNVFIRIPKFYIKKTDGVNSKTWQISKRNFTGSYLPWCFWDFANSVALPYIDIGKYPATLSGDNKLESKPGKYPLINKNIVDMRTYARANGAGYQQLDIHVVDVLQTLFYIEFATLNSQAIMAGYTAGQYSATHTATVTENNVNRIIVANATAALYAVGQAISVGTSLGGNQIFYGRTITSIDVVDASNKALAFDGAPVNIAVGNIVYNTGWLNDFSGWITASSGSLVSNSSGKYPMMYRGIENLWGNLLTFVDGINVNNNQGWVCPNAADYASNLFAAPYASLGYVNHNADGYPTVMGYDAASPFAALPTAVGGSPTTYYADYYYQATGQRIALLGGGWFHGAVAGLSYWNLLNASSAANVVIGARLVRKGG